MHPEEAFVPKLFQLIDDQRVIGQRNDVKVSVADNIVTIVQQVYSFKAPLDSTEHYFATNYWRTLWQKDSINYKNWGTQFYKLKMDKYLSRQQLDIKEINELTASDFYQTSYKKQILESLKKIRPFKDIRRLDIQPALSVEKDLKYFEDFVFSYKVLDDIPKLFAIDIENASTMLDFLEKKSATFSYSERGSFYNNLFRTNWLNDFLTSAKLSESKKEIIKNSLLTYLDESEFLSEYEEQNTFLNLAKLENIGKTLDSKMKTVFEMEIENASKTIILEEIIAGVTFDQIELLVMNFDALNDILGDKTCAFFHRDFGLPIFQIRSEKEQRQILKNLRNLSEFDFYKHYLTQFGIDFLDKSEKLDFDKIYRILQFDIVSPLSSEGASKRDEYIFGIIRLMEIHFSTRLGFHEKLNESQTFYSFSSSKRAQSWINYLKKNHLVDQKQPEFIPF